MKSLQMFIEKYNSKKAIRISQAAFINGNPIVSLPFYAIESFLRAGQEFTAALDREVYL